MASRRPQDRTGPPCSSSARQGSSRSRSERFPKAPWRDNRKTDCAGHRENILVSGHQYVSPADHRAGHDPSIVRVVLRPWRRLGGNDHVRVLANERGDRPHAASRHPQLVRQNPFELTENRVAGEKRVFGEHDPQHVLAETAGRKCSHQHVGVQQYSHETSAKTSSSVSQPWASANGATCRLRSARRAIAICRLIASRTNSLLRLPDRAANSRRSESSLSSSRMVKVVM